MKLVAATGGLGNQMFEYAFMLRLSKEHKARMFHPYKDHSERYGHAGFQLDDVFDLRPIDQNYDLGVCLFGVFWHVIRLLPKKIRPFMMRLAGFNEVKVDMNFVFYPEVFNSFHNNELFMGTWQSEHYFEGAENEVKKAFTFKEELLNENSRQLKHDIESCNSVSVHVRRDDYLSIVYVEGFGGICTVAYYAKAIAYMKENTCVPKFYVFSDDIGWCRENLDIGEAVFVDWNHGDESWQDMYLMSRCHHNIIANSTFSWWGAWLNPNPDKIVIAPDRWWNGLVDDVVPNAWVKLNGNHAV